MKLMLASSSPYRAELLARLGLPFAQAAPEIDEARRSDEAPDVYVLRLAEEKARRFAAPERVVIGSDQVAVLMGEVLGKPTTRAAAEEQLRQLSGSEAEFFTGLCLVAPDRQARTHCIRTRVCYRKLNVQQIRGYLDHENALGCAATLRSEGLGIALLRQINSDDPTALIGLPLITLAGWLADTGLDPLNPCALP